MRAREVFLLKTSSFIVKTPHLLLERSQHVLDGFIFRHFLIRFIVITLRRYRRFTTCTTTTFTITAAFATRASYFYCRSYFEAASLSSLLLWRRRIFGNLSSRSPLKTPQTPRRASPTLPICSSVSTGPFLSVSRALRTLFPRRGRNQKSRKTFLLPPLSAVVVVWVVACVRRRRRRSARRRRPRSTTTPIAAAILLPKSRFLSYSFLKRSSDNVLYARLHLLNSSVAFGFLFLSGCVSNALFRKAVLISLLVR